MRNLSLRILSLTQMALWAVQQSALKLMVMMVDGGSSGWQTAEEVKERGRPLGGKDTEEGAAAATAWMEQADHAMDVWADVLGVGVDHGNGVSREERARCEASPYYVGWDGPPLLSFDYTPIW